MHQIESQKTLEAYLDLDTLDDASDVAKQYAFINKEAKDITKIMFSLEDELEDSNIYRLINEAEIRTDEISMRSDVSIKILKDMKGKIEKYLRRVK